MTKIPTWWMFWFSDLSSLRILALIHGDHSFLFSYPILDTHSLRRRACPTLQAIASPSQPQPACHEDFWTCSMHNYNFLPLTQPVIPFPLFSHICRIGRVCLPSVWARPASHHLSPILPAPSFPILLTYMCASCLLEFPSVPYRMSFSL